MRTISLGFWYAESERWRKKNTLRESYLSFKVGRRKHFLGKDSIDPEENVLWSHSSERKRKRKDAPR